MVIMVTILLDYVFGLLQVLDWLHTVCLVVMVRSCRVVMVVLLLFSWLVSCLVVNCGEFVGYVTLELLVALCILL